MTKQKKPVFKRLQINFHRTFAPERQYLGALLKYAAASGLYEKQAIAEATGIPTGLSSGKALPTADYCLAMHLVKRKKTELGVCLELTPFGRAVFLEDRFFLEEITQWLAHLYLCNKEDGAEAWHHLFFVGSNILGNNFSSEALCNWLCPTLKAKNLRFLRPTIKMYEDEASFARCGAIIEENELYKRKKPPIDASFAIAYAAWLTDYIERNERSGQQVSVDELEQFCGFRSISGWSLAESQQVLALLEQKGTFIVDRHMRPWLLKNKHHSDELWRRLYEDLV